MKKTILILPFLFLFSLSYSQDRKPIGWGSVAMPSWEEWAKENLSSGFRPLSYKPDTVSLVFIGDVMMHTPQIRKADTADGYRFDTYFKHIRGILSKADFSIANMEFTLGGKPYTGYPSFSAPDSYPHYIAGCGVNVFLAANNHILDKGLPGIKRTIGAYSGMEKSGKARFTGISSDSADYVKRTPLMLSYHGIKVGIINFTYGTNQNISQKYPKVNRMDKKEISKAILSAKRQGADCIIAMPHWGTEYELVHSKTQEELAKWLACEGADIIIGSHPHVIQDTSSVKIKGKTVPIIYSMGNAISNMSAPNTRLELAVKVEITKNEKDEKAILRPRLVFLWCTLPGKICDSYATIFVKDNMGRYGRWKDKSDYDNMVATYKRVKKITGIED